MLLFSGMFVIIFLADENVDVNDKCFKMGSASSDVAAILQLLP